MSPKRKTLALTILLLVVFLAFYMVLVQPSVKAPQQVSPTRTFEEANKQVAAHIDSATRDVEPGDTVWSIASGAGITPGELCRWNGIENADSIYVGQRLLLQSPE